VLVDNLKIRDWAGVRTYCLKQLVAIKICGKNISEGIEK